MTGRRGGRAGGVARVLVVNGLVLAGLLGLVEGAVRLVRPEIGPVGVDRRLFVAGAFGASPGLRPGATGRAGGAVFAVGAHGHWRYTAGGAGRAGWLFLGDSVTMGPGVPPDSTFAGRLAAWADTLADPLAVWNPSLVGYASDDYVRVLEAHLARGGVRRVTLFWCLNDVLAGRPVATLPAGARRLDGPLMRFVRAHVRTYTWAKAALADRPKAYHLHDRALYAPERGYLGAALDYLRRMAEACRRRGVPFAVVLLPYEYGLRTGDRAPQRRLVEALGSAGISALDLSEGLRAQPGPPSGLYLYGDGIHLSARGHRAVAALLVRSPIFTDASRGRPGGAVVDSALRWRL